MPWYGYKCSYYNIFRAFRKVEYCFRKSKAVTYSKRQHCGFNCNRILRSRFCTCAQTQTRNTHLRTNPDVQRAQHAHAHRPMGSMGPHGAHGPHGPHGVCNARKTHLGTDPDAQHAQAHESTIGVESTMSKFRVYLYIYVCIYNALLQGLHHWHYEQIL